MFGISYNKKIFYQIKFITIIKNYDQSVEINHDPDWKRPI